jgi:type I restriction enzyme M protein
MIKWWNKRKKSDVAWKVKVEDLKKGFDLDVKNPTTSGFENELTANEILIELRKSLEKATKSLEKLTTEL